MCALNFQCPQSMLSGIMISQFPVFSVLNNPNNTYTYTYTHTHTYTYTYTYTMNKLLGGWLVRPSLKVIYTITPIQLMGFLNECIMSNNTPLEHTHTRTHTHTHTHYLKELVSSSVAANPQGRACHNVRAANPCGKHPLNQESGSSLRLRATRPSRFPRTLSGGTTSTITTIISIIITIVIITSIFVINTISIIA